MSTTATVVALGGAFLLILLAAAVAAGETALTGISRARAESLAADDEPGADALVEVLADRPGTLSPLLLVRVACHVGAATLVAVVVEDRWSSPWIAVAVVATIVVTYVAAEAIPRTWALQHLDLAARVAARVVRTALTIAPLGWLTRFLNGIANLLLPGPAGQPVVSEDELMALTEAAAASDSIEDEERDLIESVFALGDTIVREIMVPRTDMVVAESTQTISEVIDLAIDRGLSRMPVCGDGVDDIVGLCLVRDLTGAERAGHGDRPVGTEMRRARFIPETKHVDDLLREMQAGSHHMAIVVDEYGGTAGLVTLEDVVEELVGEIVDEYDQETPLLEPLAGGEALVHGRMPVDQLNHLSGAELPDGDWDTVGGLIFNTLGHVPEIGEVVTVEGVVLRVERMEGRRITRVRLTHAPAPEEAPAPGDGPEDDAVAEQSADRSEAS